MKFKNNNKALLGRDLFFFSYSGAYLGKMKGMVSCPYKAKATEMSLCSQTNFAKAFCIWNVQVSIITYPVLNISLTLCVPCDH